jgi:CubicO group peptidase (beta-lactamase class C family)
MKRRMFLQFSAFATALIAKQCMSQSRQVRDVSEKLAAIQRQFGFPGIAAAVVRGNSIVAEGVAGVRRVDGEEKIALDDRFAMASCTKKMTAAMIGGGD